MWIVKSVEVIFGFAFTVGGIYPLTLKGLPGVLLSPFIHADFKHLLSNSIPLFLLSTALFYFYSEISMKILSLAWLFTGLLVWIAGRDAWHIGASGLVYSLASFLFFSGILRGYFRLVALCRLLSFCMDHSGEYSGIYRNVSWESHMLGFFSGLVLAIWFRKEGPQKPVYDWMLEDEDE